MPNGRLIMQTIDRGRHTVLVVDDNPATRYSTVRVLRGAGFQTVEAATGTQALERVGHGVSGVVLDVHLPDMNGFDVCRRIRADAATGMLPVVHLSAAYINDEDRVTGLNAGADAYLVHPVEPAVLVATLQALIRARLAEDSLRRSEARFREIYDHAPSGIALVDAQGRFADANPAMLRLLGRARDDVLGRAVSDFAVPEWRHTVHERIRESEAGMPWQGDIPLLHADGHRVHLEWSMSQSLEPGLRIGIAQDVSERIQLARQRQELLRHEQAARHLAEHTNRTKDDFIGVLSHELRTPLNAIAGWVEVLTRRADNPELLRGLSIIERNVRTQALILSDLLDVARINSGTLRLAREAVEPAALVNASVESLRPSIDARKLTVELELEGAQRAAWLDPARFQQVFWNLMTNAIKFSAPGGVLRVGLRREGEVLELVVQDHGAGVRAEFLPHLFDRFAQVDAPGKRVKGGLGLGLSIVKHLVEMHGGTVGAHSAGEGQGTTVRVRLPVAVPPEPTAHDTAGLPPPAAPLPAGRSAVSGLDVLLVEDDADASEMLSIVLAEHGATVRCVPDHAAALEALRRQWPALLISDIGLPGKDGHALLRAVRELEAAGGLRRTPCVALTAFARQEDQARALASGFDLHLSKPLAPQEVMRALERMLDGWHARNG